MGGGGGQLASGSDGSCKIKRAPGAQQERAPVVQQERAPAV